MRGNPMRSISSPAAPSNSTVIVALVFAPILAIILASSLAFLLSPIISISSSQSTPNFQSVSGEFAAKWIKDFKEENGLKAPAADINGAEGNHSTENDSDLWSWGKAPLGSKIVDGKLVRDPNYLRPLLNLSANWLDESYTDSDTGLPVDVYSDPLTGRKYYRLLKPTTGQPFFSYYTYKDEKTGRLVYVYTDPVTGEEVHSSSKPADVIDALARGISAQTF
jgi:hypothetical protein